MSRICWICWFAMCIARSVHGAEFLGVELCKGSVDTAVELPRGTPLSLDRVEVGRQGGLILVLRAGDADALDAVDDLMATATGVRGSGTASELQWVGHRITGYAQVLKNGLVALAVTSDDSCGEAMPDEQNAEQPAAVGGDRVDPGTAGGETPRQDAAAGAVLTAPNPSTESAQRKTVGPSTPEAPGVPLDGTPPEASDFALIGDLKHEAAGEGWVDVMGIVVNRSGPSLNVTSFDLSLYDASARLICVDTISINQLKTGQERAFRTALRCPDYSHDEVALWRLQFAGGH